MDPFKILIAIWIPLLAVLPGVILASRNTHFTRQPSLDNRIFGEDHLWETTSESTLGCAERCASDLKCVAFTCTKVTSVRLMTCRGHSKTVTSSGMASPGTMLYNVDRRTVPEWLGTECSSNDDCAQTYSVCFAQKCLCTPGYYYSNSKRTCSRKCSDLQSTFVNYPRWYISMNNLGDETLSSVDDCRDWCVSLDHCVSFEYSEGSARCYVSAVTPLDKPDRWGESMGAVVVSYWQRTCL